MYCQKYWFLWLYLQGWLNVKSHINFLQHQFGEWYLFCSRVFAKTYFSCTVLGKSYFSCRDCFNPNLRGKSTRSYPILWYPFRHIYLRTTINDSYRRSCINHVHKTVPTSRIKVLQSLRLSKIINFLHCCKNNKFSALQQIYDIYPAAVHSQPRHELGESTIVIVRIHK